MKLLIFGATGGTGIQLVEQALGQGHTVTALVRNPAKLEIQHPNLHVVAGDVLTLASVEQVMPGHDAVLSTLGAPASDNIVRSAGTQNIIRAMAQNGIQRFVCMTTLGIGDSRNLLPLLYKYLLVPLLLRRVFADSERQENYIRQSQLDWTIIRPAVLIDTPRTGVYQHGFTAVNKALKLKIARADVADFILKQLGDKTYLHKTASLSY